jgi:penicillin V acylase-like amidase (Ntn superfamily)
MKKKIFFLISGWLMLLPQVFPCTTFFINKNGELIFGRNYDWVTGAGMVCTNLKGLYKTSLKENSGSTISWVSTYGSITFNQYGKEFPTGGMNETGLVVELMWAEGSKYPTPDNRPVVNVLQWIQYQLDNHSTIDEVIATDAKLRIDPNDPPLHYLVADANDDAATIEFLKGKMVVHKGKDLPFPVLTNSSYAQSEKTVRDLNLMAGNRNFSLGDNSLQRFATACSMVQQYQLVNIKRQVIDYAFYILNKVAQPDFTKWSIVYDISKKKIYFKTDSYPDVKSISFDGFNFTCSSVAKVIYMNQAMKGNVNGRFTRFSSSLNRIIMDAAINESWKEVPVSDKEKENYISYAAAIKCKE